MEALMLAPVRRSPAKMQDCQYKNNEHIILQCQQNKQLFFTHYTLNFEAL